MQNRLPLWDQAHGVHMKRHFGNHQSSSYVSFGSTGKSPIARPCPRCNAKIGQSCRALKSNEIFPLRMKTFHSERKIHRINDIHG